MRLRAPELQGWVRRLLQASGVPTPGAEAAAEVFCLATLRGLGHHDVSYLPQRLEWLAQSKVNRNPALELVSRSPATEVWEGDGGLGEVLCHHITQRALDLARTQGLGYAVVRNSNHFLAAAPYVEIASRQGFFALVWSNTDAGMAFPGGRTRQIGNNPLGFGLGTGDQSLAADLSLAYSSLGNLNTLAREGKPVPLHWGLDADGKPTESADDLLSGAVGPIAGAKGLSLALLGEVITGVLAGGPTLDQVAPRGGLNTHNQMVLAWDLEAFGGRNVVQERVDSLKNRARALNPQGRLPGERSREHAQKSELEGIPLEGALFDDLRSWSDRLGVELPNTL